jgi:ferredoxin
MKAKRKIVQIDEERCNGCGQCASACAEGAIAIIDGKAKLTKDSYCDGLGACIGECPQGALQIIERETDVFDPVEVEHHLIQQKKYETGQELPCGCPSSHLQMFSSSCEKANQPSYQPNNESALSHWPIQIRLIPPTAPFLKNADLLVAADCTPVAYPDLHRDFLKGKVVMVGCPKFDDTDEYINKFTDIFKVAGIQSVTILIMEVPCCSKLPLIVQKGTERAGKEIPVEVVVIGARGKILRRQKLAA